MYVCGLVRRGRGLYLSTSSIVFFPPHSHPYPPSNKLNSPAQTNKFNQRVRGDILEHQFSSPSLPQPDQYSRPRAQSLSPWNTSYHSDVEKREGGLLVPCCDDQS